jgi:hypothetical protein
MCENMAGEERSADQVGGWGGGGGVGIFIMHRVSVQFIRCLHKPANTNAEHQSSLILFGHHGCRGGRRGGGEDDIFLHVIYIFQNRSRCCLQGAHKNVS